MGKPVVSSIQPPPSPPVTNWTYSNIATSARYALSSNTTQFNSLISLFGFNWAGAGITPSSYNYVFLASNGKDDVDLTVNTANLGSGIVAGGNAKDLINGNDYNEVFFAGNGMDVVNAGGGNDNVFGGNGVDTVHGNAGDDRLFGENSDDTLYGDAGDDLLSGGLNNDTLFGGTGNDDLYGNENDDKLDGGADNGTASATEGESSTELTLKEDHPGFLTELPTGHEDADSIPDDLDVAKVGIYAATDGDGHPTELDINGEPVLHYVYSVTPAVTGDYTITYMHGNDVDGPGNPEPDIQHVHLEAGQIYYFNLIYDPGDNQAVKVEAYDGTLDEDDVEDNPGPTVLDFVTATIPDFHAFFDVNEIPGEATVELTAGDDLWGGSGADTFCYDPSVGPNNVDFVHDYSQAEGDSLYLKGVADSSAYQVIYDDVDGDSQTDTVLFFSDDHAIALLGIDDINNVTITFGP